jgi:phosphohistidine swiveling domain-containing protein
MALIIDLDAAEARDPGQVGGKGAALAALGRQGFLVPPTLCLTTAAYDVFVDTASLRPVIRQELGRKNFADMRWEEIWDTALRIRNRFLRAPMPDRIRSEVGERLDGAFATETLAVRSSALGEDAEGASFAGLHDSVVGVRGLDETLDAVRSVWASLWTDRALLYRRELGIDPSSSTMAVVIQRLVEGRVSGIGFGSHPVNPGQLAVEAVHGLNQGLVEGTIEPDHWAVDSATGRIVEHRPPDVRRRLVLDNGSPRVEAPPNLPPPLDRERLNRVIDAVRAAGRVFACPQDVEWTIADDGLVLLQSRPITTGAGEEDDKRSWYLSLTRSLENLRGLRSLVEDELLPAMNREADDIAAQRLEELDNHELAAGIEHRRATHDRWVDTYWREFIPFAHGIRLFGQFYNEIVRPHDPHEFMRLLGGTPMLSLRRNQRLAELAAMIRNDAGLRASLENGSVEHRDFASALESFLADFGTAVYANQACFADRQALMRLLLVMATSPPAPVAIEDADVETMTRAFLEAVPVERRPVAEELLEMGRSSYQIRDDDNIHLARHKALVLEAVDVGRRRLAGGSAADVRMADPDQVIAALRHPNLVVEPPRPATELVPEGGLRPQPRQLVGQPAGPGLATGPARIIDGVEDLFEIQPGEVLVCDAVEPNMTFVVPMVCAVVERRGGMLIHGAIIAREYGLPCVTGVPDATTRISNGDRLTVDGHLGIVTVSPVQRD